LSVVRIIRSIDDRRLIEELRDLWRGRGILAVLIKRDIAVRYRQAALGILWAVLQPVVTTAIFTIVFVVFIRLPSPDVPYPVFAFAGVVIWQYFSRAVTEGTSSLVINSSLITKVYFPRIVVPLVAPCSAALDCLLGVAALLVIALLFHAEVHWTAVLVPFVLLFVGLFGYAVALCLAPLHAIYRDIGILLPFTLQVAMYLSPIAYPASIVPESVRWLYRLSPVAVMVDAMRWALLGSEPPSAAGVVFTLVLTVLLFWGGLNIFRRLEGTLVDRI
jgi:homopolymeric O-antigen transport system permease protein